MSYSNGKITAPVSIGDIQNAIGASGGGDLGTLCRHSNVNPWAKYKPVQKNKIDTTDEWDFTNSKWKSTATWWKGATNVSIGGITPKSLQITTATLPTFMGFYDGNMNGWTYDKPGGGVNQPYRQTDFAHYNHLAPPPVQGFTMNDKVSQYGRLFASALYTPQINDGDSLTLYDFTSQAFSTLYWGILIAQNNSPKLVATSQYANDATVDRRFEGSGNVLPLGTYQVYPIFSSVAMFTTNFNSISALFYTCPMCEIKTIQIVSSSSIINVTIDFKPNLTTGTSGTFQVLNGESTQLTNLKYKFDSSTSNPDPSTMTNWPTSQTVAANGESTLLVASYGSAKYIHIFFNYNGGAHYKRETIMGIMPPSPQT